jgi:hypothetical protein
MRAYEIGYQLNIKKPTISVKFDRLSAKELDYIDNEADFPASCKIGFLSSSRIMCHACLEIILDKQKIRLQMHDESVQYQ